MVCVCVCVHAMVTLPHMPGQLPSLLLSLFAVKVRGEEISVVCLCRGYLSLVCQALGEEPQMTTWEREEGLAGRRGREEPWPQVIILPACLSERRRQPCSRHCIR